MRTNEDGDTMTIPGTAYNATRAETSVIDKEENVMPLSQWRVSFY